MERPREQEHVERLRHEPHAAVCAHPHQIAAPGEQQRSEHSACFTHAGAAEAAVSKRRRRHGHDGDNEVVGRVFAEKKRKRQQHDRGERREGNIILPLINRKLQPGIILPEREASAPPSHRLQSITVPRGMRKERAAKQVVQQEIAERHQGKHAKKRRVNTRALFRL